MKLQRQQSINIMTSCDENLIRFIPIQLHSIAESLSARNVNFYLFTPKVDLKQIERLYRQSMCYKNVTFRHVFIDNEEPYEAIALYGGGWPGTAYYSLCVRHFLPGDMDRIMYLDAGDTLVVAPIDDFYFEDFDGNSLIVTGVRYKKEDSGYAPFSRDDMRGERLNTILRGLFNSGSYLINLEKMRMCEPEMSEYVEIAATLNEIKSPDADRAYWGDQGFISAAFVGDIKYYGFPCIPDDYIMPYNFCMWYFEHYNKEPPFRPAILHYTSRFKPWKWKYRKFMPRFQSDDELYDMEWLKPVLIPYYRIWESCAIRTADLLDNCWIG